MTKRPLRAMSRKGLNLKTFVYTCSGIWYMMMYMIQTIEIQIFPIKMYAIVSTYNTQQLASR